MPTSGLLAFIGASASLSDELRSIQRRSSFSVVAPAMPKPLRGLSDEALRRTLIELRSVLGAEVDPRSPARLVVFTFEPQSERALTALIEAFGSSAWIEIIPANLINKDQQTRRFVEEKLRLAIAPIHEIAHHLGRHRKASPTGLPLRNFRSDLLRQLTGLWYRGRAAEAIAAELGKLQKSFRSSHCSSGEGGFQDNRGLIFSPARDNECHGISHPQGQEIKCFVNGRFRFGAGLWPGFHFDVRAERGNLNCILYDCNGRERDMRPEHREYINIFPNDHLLPAKATK